MRTLIILLAILIIGCKKEDDVKPKPKDPKPPTEEKHFLEDQWQATRVIRGTATETLFSDYFELTYLDSTKMYYKPILSNHIPDTLYFVTDSTLTSYNSSTRMFEYSNDTLRITDVYGANIFTMPYKRN